MEIPADDGDHHGRVQRDLSGRVRADGGISVSVPVGQGPVWVKAARSDAIDGRVRKGPERQPQGGRRK